MKAPFLRPAITPLFVLLLVADALATCGGGGGGGTGGMGSGAMGAEEVVYQVPWQAIKTAPPAGSLVLYWYPASQNEWEKSSLRNSRTLSVYAQQCVTMAVANKDMPNVETFIGAGKPPVVVFAEANGKIIGRAEGTGGKLNVSVVEKLVEGEMKQRESAVKTQLQDAKDTAKKGDKATAITSLKAIVEQKCLFPNPAKDAASELKKLGVTIGGTFYPAANLDRSLGVEIEHQMMLGLEAENQDRYPEAEKRYAAALKLDPSDPAPRRYLGEVYRHQLGDWDKARVVFDAILARPSDPLSRAVALHGLGKMTIHDGNFKKGLTMMEASVAAFPLPLAYLNLAVYWHSEGDRVKAAAYTQQALALDPADPFNLVFAAAFQAGDASAAAKAEAVKVAKANDTLMCASYNLAAIYAQAGQKDRALAMLKRHFFDYERYDAVRSKEMMEARVDAVFSSLFADPTFVSLTSGADGKLPLPKKMGKR